MTFLPEIEIGKLLSPLDWLVFAFTILLTLSFVIWGNLKSPKKSTLIDEIVLGRSLTLPIFIATLVSTWYGGIFGVTEIAFNNGIYNFITQGLFWYLTYLIFAIFLVDKLNHSQAITLPDLVHKMFGQRSAKLAGIMTLFNVIPIAYTISIGLFIQTLFGYSLTLSMILGMLVVLSYSSWGGFRSVVYSDLIQFLVMCSSVFLVLLFSLQSFGIETLFQKLPAHYFSITGNHSWGETLAWGFIALSTLVDPNFYQRCFAAKDSSTAKKGILISTGIWILFDICTTTGAMYAKATIPEASSASAYLVYALQLLPEGLRGFFLGGILATILSTLDSYLFLAGTTLSHDLFPKLKLKAKNSLSIILVGILSIVIAQVFEGNIKAVWKFLGTYSASCLLTPVLYGYFFKERLKDQDFLMISLSGVIVTTLWQFSSFRGLLDELYIGLLTTLVVLVVRLKFKKN